MSFAVLLLLFFVLFVAPGLVVLGLILTLGRSVWPVVAILTAGAVIAVLIGLLVVGLFTARSTVVYDTPPRYTVAYSDEAASPPLPAPQPPAAPIPAELETPVAAETPSETPNKKSNSVLRILANALLKAIDEEEAAQINVRTATAKVIPAVLEEPLPPADQPAWVGAEPHRKDGVYQVHVAVGPYLTLEECESKLPEELNKAVADYVETRIGPEAGRRVHLPWDYLETHLIRDRWEERKEYSVGAMLRLHVLLGFDREANQRIQEEWDHLIVQKRLWGLGTLATLLLSALAVVYAYLKTDLATGGNLRGRLRLAAAAAIAVLIAAGVAAVRSGGFGP